MDNPLFGYADNNIVVALSNRHSHFMDGAMLVVTDTWCFVGVVACVIAYAFYKENWRKALAFSLLLLASMGCAYLLCAEVVRPIVKQLRPTDPANPVSAMLHIVRGYVVKGYGFPSCHAANSFAIAVFSSLWFRKRWMAVALVCWALLECYSRLYLGVHYPSDILFGSVIGGLMAYAVYLVTARIAARH